MSIRPRRAGDAAALDDDAFHWAGLLHARSERSGPPCAALHNEVGCDDASHGIEDRAAEIVDDELGNDLACLLRCQHPRLGLGDGLVHEVRFEPFDVGGVVEEEEIAVEAEVELLAHLLLEALQPSD